MKRQSEDADLDNSLKEFEMQFVWTKEQKLELKKKIFTDIGNLRIDKRKITLNDKKRYPKLVISLAASLFIIGTTMALGKSYIVDATETLIAQIFGSKEELLETFPNESHRLSEIEKHFELVKQQLTEDEFANYKQLMKKQTEILDKMALEKREYPNAEEEKRIEEIQKKAGQYEKRLEELTTHTLEEARRMVRYPINLPAYVPKGYKLESEETFTEEKNVDKDPIVEFQYRAKENGFGYRTTIQKIGHNPEGELETLKYDYINAYILKGYKFEFAYYEDSNVQGMRVTIPEKGYEIILSADILQKKEMEKILLSMIE